MFASGLAAALARIGQVQSHLSVAASMLIAMAAVGAALTEGVWLVARHVTVMAHEGAHATMASAIGHKVDGFEFRADASGVTHTSGSSGAAGVFAVTFIGYLGPSLFGLGAAELIKAGYIVAVLWIGLAGLAVISLSLRRSFGIVSVLTALLLLFFIAGFASVGVEVVTAYLIAWFLLVSSVRIITIRGKNAGDAGKLRDMTKIPAGFWSRVWLVGSLAALVFGATLLL